MVGWFGAHTFLPLPSACWAEMDLSLLPFVTESSVSIQPLISVIIFLSHELPEAGSCLPAHRGAITTSYEKGLRGQDKQHESRRRDRPPSSCLHCCHSGRMPEGVGRRERVGGREERIERRRETGWTKEDWREGGNKDRARKSFPLELKRADNSSFSTTIGAASEHNQEFRPRTVRSFHWWPTTVVRLWVSPLPFWAASFSLFPLAGLPTALCRDAGVPEMRSAL